MSVLVKDATKNFANRRLRLLYTAFSIHTDVSWFFTGSDALGRGGRRSPCCCSPGAQDAQARHSGGRQTSERQLIGNGSN